VGLRRRSGAGQRGPGQNVTFNFNVTAPSTPGMYNFQWKMVQDFVEWFGLPLDSRTHVLCNPGILDLIRSGRVRLNRAKIKRGRGR
jgi:hypothetical protein